MATFLSRRNWLRSASVLSASTALNFRYKEDIHDLSLIRNSVSENDLVTDESFWYRIKNLYTTSPTILNLNNGGVSPAPFAVQEAVDRYNRLSNEAPSYYMWRILDQGREPLRQKLADLSGCSKEEIAIVRNASEALETAIFGIQLKKGDKVVVSSLDYPNMMNAWKQRQIRDGIELIKVDLDLPTMNNDQIIQAFKEAISKGPKVVHITHIVNWNGHILPAREIADLARNANAKVVIDGAHSFCHITYSIPDLAPDYYGTSLHKWLCAPIGTGMLYVKRSEIGSLYPLLASPEPLSDDIRKFESLGTRSFPIEQAIGQAIDFQLMIGHQLKERRLHYLKKYWTDKVKEHPKIRIHTATESQRSCAIANVSIDGLSPQELSEKLMNDYKIHTVAVEHEKVKSTRVTPHVYTVLADLERFCSALIEIAAKT